MAGGIAYQNAQEVNQAKIDAIAEASGNDAADSIQTQQPSRPVVQKPTTPPPSSFIANHGYEGNSDYYTPSEGGTNVSVEQPSGGIETPQSKGQSFGWAGTQLVRGSQKEKEVAASEAARAKSLLDSQKPKAPTQSARQILATERTPSQSIVAPSLERSNAVVSILNQKGNESESKAFDSFFSDVSKRGGTVDIYDSDSHARIGSVKADKSGLDFIKTNFANQSIFIREETKNNFSSSDQRAFADFISSSARGGDVIDLYSGDKKVGTVFGDDAYKQSMAISKLHPGGLSAKTRPLIDVYPSSKPSKDELAQRQSNLKSTHDFEKLVSQSRAEGATELTVYGPSKTGGLFGSKGEKIGTIRNGNLHDALIDMRAFSGKSVSLGYEKNSGQYLSKSTGKYTEEPGTVPFLGLGNPLVPGKEVNIEKSEVSPNYVAFSKIFSGRDEQPKDTGLHVGTKSSGPIIPDTTVLMSPTSILDAVQFVPFTKGVSVARSGITALKTGLKQGVKEGATDTIKIGARVEAKTKPTTILTMQGDNKMASVYKDVSISVKAVNPGKKADVLSTKIGSGARKVSSQKTNQGGISDMFATGSKEVGSVPKQKMFRPTNPTRSGPGKGVLDTGGEEHLSDKISASQKFTPRQKTMEDVSKELQQKLSNTQNDLLKSSQQPVQSILKQKPVELDPSFKPHPQMKSLEANNGISKNKAVVDTNSILGTGQTPPENLVVGRGKDILSINTDTAAYIGNGGGVFGSRADFIRESGSVFDEEGLGIFSKGKKSNLVKTDQLAVKKVPMKRLGANNEISKNTPLVDTENLLGTSHTPPEDLLAGKAALKTKTETPFYLGGGGGLYGSRADFVRESASVFNEKGLGALRTSTLAEDLAVKTDQLAVKKIPMKRLGANNGISKNKAVVDTESLLGTGETPKELGRGKDILAIKTDTSPYSGNGGGLYGSRADFVRESSSVFDEKGLGIFSKGKESNLVKIDKNYRNTLPKKSLGPTKENSKNVRKLKLDTEGVLGTGETPKEPGRAKDILSIKTDLPKYTGDAGGVYESRADFIQRSNSVFDDKGLGIFSKGKKSNLIQTDQLAVKKVPMKRLGANNGISKNKAVVDTESLLGIESNKMPEIGSHSGWSESISNIKMSRDKQEISKIINSGGGSANDIGKPVRLSTKYGSGRKSFIGPRLPSDTVSSDRIRIKSKSKPIKVLSNYSFKDDTKISAMRKEGEDNTKIGTRIEGKAKSSQDFIAGRESFIGPHLPSQSGGSRWSSINIRLGKGKGFFVSKGGKSTTFKPGTSAKMSSDKQEVNKMINSGKGSTKDIGKSFTQKQGPKEPPTTSTKENLGGKGATTQVLVKKEEITSILNPPGVKSVSTFKEYPVPLGEGNAKLASLGSGTKYDSIDILALHPSQETSIKDNSKSFSAIKPFTGRKSSSKIDTSQIMGQFSIRGSRQSQPTSYRLFSGQKQNQGSIIKQDQGQKQPQDTLFKQAQKQPQSQKQPQDQSFKQSSKEILKQPQIFKPLLSTKQGQRQEYAYKYKTPTPTKQVYKNPGRPRVHISRGNIPKKRHPVKGILGFTNTRKHNVYNPLSSRLSIINTR